MRASNGAMEVDWLVTDVLSPGESTAQVFSALKLSMVARKETVTHTSTPQLSRSPGSASLHTGLGRWTQINK